MSKWRKRFSTNAWQGCKSSPAGGGPASFPPSVVVAVKALACELPHQTGLPLSRLSTADLRRAAIDRGIVANIDRRPFWRWLSEDAIKPWTHRSWVFPRDPDFEAKAAPILDLYQDVGVVSPSLETSSSSAPMRNPVSSAGFAQGMSRPLLNLVG